MLRGCTCGRSALAQAVTVDSRSVQVARALVIAIAIGIGGCTAVAVYGVAREVFGPPYGSDGPRSGWSALFTGDVDGDGLADILLFTRFEPVGWSYGSARVFSTRSGRCLSTSGRAGSQLWDGGSLERAGDLDGDGDDDLLVGRGGQVVVVDAKSGAAGRSFPTDPSSICAVLGDVDGDGRSDLLVSGFPRAPKDVRRVSAVSGASGACLWTIEGRARRTSNVTTRPFASNGIVVGDVDRDGIRDAVIDTERDRLRVISGRDGSTLREIDASFDWISGSLAAPGDIDRDGAADLLFLNDWGTEPVRLVSLGTGRELAAIPPGRPWDLSSVAVPGDVDGDGTADLALLGFGRFLLHSGADARELAHVQAQYGDGGIDVNGDGCADLVVTINVRDGAAAAFDDDELWRAGKLRVLSGRDQSVLLEIDGDDLEPVKR